MTLGETEVHIWLWEIAQYTHFSKHDLNGYEVKRWEKLKGKMQSNYQCTHGMLKWILSRYFANPPTAIGDLEMEVSAHGKPRLIGEYSNLQFNLSHSGAYAALALTWQDPIGIDLENMHRDYHSDIATRFFSDTECQQIQMLDAEHRPACFYSIWSQKEALSKATGHGISHGDWKSFSLEGGRAQSDICYQNQNWKLFSFPILSKYYLSVASSQHKNQFQIFDLIRGEKITW